jgi:hypothetical protein
MFHTLAACWARRAHVPSAERYAPIYCWLISAQSAEISQQKTKSTLLPQANPPALPAAHNTNVL